MKFALPLLLATLSFNAFSASITCTIEPMLTNDIGLLPGEEFAITVEVDNKKCTNLNKMGKELSFCASEDDIIGIHNITLVTEEPGAVTYSWALVGVSRSTSKLEIIKGETEILSNLFKKVTDADILIPSELNRGDSGAVDVAIEEAFNKKIVQKGEVVAFEIASCSLSK